ncbi:MAG: CHAT domain-containing protein [Nostocaceae cyanobacterium]|nr:CHAT domain-containing protein [Nostocaceae cyanobacterium]
MEKRVIFRLGDGDFRHGFELVTLEISQNQPDQSLQKTQFQSRLPPAPDLPGLYQQWQHHCQTLFLNSPLWSGDRGFKKGQVTNVSVQEFDRCTNDLRERFNQWLHLENSHFTAAELVEQIGSEPDSEIYLVIQTGQLRSPEIRNIIHRLPWHWWEIFGDRHPLEFTFNFTDTPATNVQPETFPISGRLRRVKILSILGDSQNIHVEKDQQLIAELRTKGASPVFLAQPQRDELMRLWDESWDILCFSGHSESDADYQTGWLAINPQETISIEELKNALRTARNQGLQLVIFNSCNGLGLAQALTQINLPYLLIWREPVPDRVAQQFLHYFLQSFAMDKSLHTAMREAREKLQLTVGRYLPGVTGLPAIVQNASQAPPIWTQIRRTGGRITSTNWSVVNPESRQEAENRQILLNKVNNSWIKKVLETSLQSQFRIELGLEEQFDAIALPCQMAWETPDHHRRILPHGTRVVDKFDELGLGRTLLILGEPGSGKTTMLLELARDLLIDAQSDVTLPIPVVLNLSSWGMNPPTKTLAHWLVEELGKQYQVPQIQGKPWVEQQKLLLLLDGLDEVKVAQRELCLKAINDFIQTHVCTEIVVCSRLQDYHNLSEKLRCQAAIYLQPLTSEQIQSYFEQGGSELGALKTIWHDDDIFQELATNPLMLNIMTIAYQGVSLTDLPKINSLAERRRHLFDTYITRMFNRRGGSQIYSKERALHWLTVLAQQMVYESQTIFLIEQTQPEAWLKTRTLKWLYRLSVSLVIGAIAGLASGCHFGVLMTKNNFLELTSFVLTGVIAGIISGILSIIIPGLLSGLIFGVIVWLIAGHRVLRTQPDFISLLSPLLIDGTVLGVYLSLIRGKIEQIKIVEIIKWSWSGVKSYARNGVILGLIYVLMRILFFPDRYANRHYFFLLELLIFSLISGLVGGLSRGAKIEKTVIPNQGIGRSVNNARFLFMIFALIGIVFAQFYSDGILEGISLGLAVGILAALAGGQRSGFTLIQHLTLRVILWWKHDIPWNYARFLDYAAERILLKKVGGGYIFIHRLLLEHLASIPK